MIERIEHNKARRIEMPEGGTIPPSIRPVGDSGLIAGERFGPDFEERLIAVLERIAEALEKRDA